MLHVLKRCFSYLVLLSFTFQTLLPSFAWAIDSDNESQTSQLINNKNDAINRPLSQRSTSFDSNNPFRSDNLTTTDLSSRKFSDLFDDDFTLETLALPFIDTKEDPFESQFRMPILSIPELRTLKDDQWESFKVLFEAHSFYGDLQTHENENQDVDALLWSAYGFQFVLKDNGELSVTGDLGKETSKTLRIDNPNGLLNLDQGLTLTHLLAKAESVIQSGVATRIDVLDVWAVGKDGKTGQLLNEDFKTLTASHITLHEGNFENKGRVSIEGNGSLDCKDHNLINYATMIFGKDSCVTGVHTLENRFYGKMKGLQKLSLKRGFNQGKIKSKNLTLTVFELFTNQQTVGYELGRSSVTQPEGIFNIEETFETSGTGTFRQEGTLKTKTLILDNQAFVQGRDSSVLKEHRYANIHIGRHVQTWLNSKDSVLTADTFTIAEALLAKVANEGVMTFKKLTNRAYSFQNRGSMTLDELEQFGSGNSLTNEEGGEIEINNLAHFGPWFCTLTNKGTFTLQGKTRGKIYDLVNHGGLFFEGETRLEGTKLTNHQLFRARNLFEWVGETLTNHHTMTVFNNQITANKQLINHNLFRWTAGGYRTSHLLNLTQGIFEMTPHLEGKKSSRAIYLGAKEDTSTTLGFKASTLDNRGFLRFPGMSHGKSFKHWNNSGQLFMNTLHLNPSGVDDGLNSSFINTGHLTLSGYLTGQINDFLNHGKIRAEQGIETTSQSFVNPGELLTPGVFKTHVIEEMINTGRIQADKGFLWKVKTLANSGKMIGNVQKQKSIIEAIEKITTDKESLLYVFSLDLKTPFLEHNGVLRHGSPYGIEPDDNKVFPSQTLLDIGTLHNLGTIDQAKNALQATLEIRGSQHPSKIINEGFIGGDSLTVKAKEINSLKDAHWVADETLSFDLRSSTKHYGKMQAQELIYKSPVYIKNARDGDHYPTLLNHGKIISTEKTLLETWFQNTKEGYADLTRLTLIEGSGNPRYAFYNDGMLRLDRVEFLGTDPREIVNREKATFLVENSGYKKGDSPLKNRTRSSSYRSVEEFNNREKALEGVKDARKGGFAFGKISNLGICGFSNGTYHIGGIYENRGIHQSLRGQDLRYLDLINKGEIQADHSYEVDHTKAKVTKLGKFRIKGELYLGIGDQEDAAEALQKSDILADKEITVDTKTFINPYDLTLQGNWKFKMKDMFHNLKKLTLTPFPETASLTVLGGGFRVGWYGPDLAELDVYGPLTVDVSWNIDSQWGKIRTLGKTKLKTPSDFYVGAAVQSGDKHVSNGAKLIVGKGRLDIESNNITTSFGAVYGQGVSVYKALNKISNKTGKIYGGYSMYFKAPFLENILGDADTVQGNAHYYSWAYRRHQQNHSGVITEYEQVERVNSDPAEIKTTRGNIEIEVNHGLNKGSTIFAPGNVTIKNLETSLGKSSGTPLVHYPALHNLSQDIQLAVSHGLTIYNQSTGQLLLNDGTFIYQAPQLGTPGSSSFRDEDVALVTRYRHWENGNLGAEDRGVISYQNAFYKGLTLGGQQMNVQMGDLLVTGSMGAPIVTFNVGNFFLKNISDAQRKDMPNTNIVINLREVLEHAYLQKQHPLFKNQIAEGKGVGFDGLGEDRSLVNYRDAVRMDTTPLTKQPTPFMSPEVTRIVFMDALLKSLGTLNVQGKSGDFLFSQFVLNGHDVQNQLARSGRALTWDELASSKKSFLFETLQQIEGRLYSVLSLLATPEDRMPYTKDGASVTGNILNINATNNIAIEGGAVYSTVSTTLKALQDITVKSIALRRGSNQNYREEKLSAILGSKGNQSVSAKNIHFQGIEAYADQMRVFAEQNGIDQPLELHSQERTSGSGLQRVDTYVNNSVSQHRYKTLYHFFTGSNQIQAAIDAEVEDGDMIFEAGGDLSFPEVHNRHAYQEESKQQKKGMFGNKTTETQSSGFEANSLGAKLKANKGQIQGISHHGNITLTNMKAITPTFILKALEGSIIFALGTNHSGSSKSQKIVDLLWQKIAQEIQEHKTYTASEFSGMIEAYAKQVIVQKVNPQTVQNNAQKTSAFAASVIKDQTIEWLHRIHLHGATGIDIVLMDELHKVDSKTVQGPTPALCAVIALAAGAAAAASGAGTALAGQIIGALELSAAGTAAATVSYMSIGAIASLSSQAAIALVGNEGNIGRAAQSLANSDTLKAMMMGAAIAGVTGGLAHKMGVSLNATDAKGAIDHIQREALRTSVKMSFDLAQGQNLEEAFTQGIRYGVAGVVGGLVANQIGLAREGEDGINPVTHKLLHGLLGGATGATLNKDMKKGALAGALGAVVAETFAEVFGAEAKLIQEKVDQKAREQGLDPERDDISHITYEEIKGTIDLSVLAASLVTLLTGQDVGIGILTATNAVENNWASSQLRKQDQLRQSRYALEPDSRLDAGEDQERRDFIEAKLEQARSIRDRSFSPTSLKTNTERFNDQFYEYMTARAEGDAMLRLASLAPIGKAASVGVNLTKQAIQQGIKRAINAARVGKNSEKIDQVNILQQVKDWLGDGYKALTNKSGDRIFISKDGQRKMRFDIENSHGDKPHIHLEAFKNGQWRDAVHDTHRIYPKQ